MSETIGELRRLEGAATPGEWGIAVWGGALLVAPVRNTSTFVCELGRGSEDAQRDAALIVAARNALPSLLRVAEAARELQNTLTAYERGDCSRTAITVARGHLTAALAALDEVQP